MKKFGRPVALSTATAIATLCIVLGGQAFVAQAGPNTGLTWKTLTLKNGWTGGPFSTRKPAVAISNGIVYFKGAMATTKTNVTSFVLPLAYRPAKNVYVSVDLCSSNYGRLYIQPNGTVEVEAESAFSSAQCFTSLDGVSFAK